MSLYRANEMREVKTSKLVVVPKVGSIAAIIGGLMLSDELSVVSGLGLPINANTKTDSAVESTTPSLTTTSSGDFFYAAQLCMEDPKALDTNGYPYQIYEAVTSLADVNLVQVKFVVPADVDNVAKTVICNTHYDHLPLVSAEGEKKLNTRRTWTVEKPYIGDKPFWGQQMQPGMMTIQEAEAILYNSSVVTDYANATEELVQLDWSQDYITDSNDDDDITDPTLKMPLMQKERLIYQFAVRTVSWGVDVANYGLLYVGVDVTTEDVVLLQ